MRVVEHMPLQGTTGHHGAKAKGCQRTQQGGADRAPTPANDVAALQNEQGLYVPNDNYRNPSREAKHQRELLTTSIMYVHWLGRKQDLRCVNQQSWGKGWHLSVLFRTSISRFQDYPIIPRTFI